MAFSSKAGPKLEEAQGIVLQARNVGEHDRVYDCFTEHAGLLTVWHTGARSQRRGKAPALAPFVSYRLSLRPKASGHALFEAQVVAERPGLRTSLAALARAGQLCHVVRAVWPPGEPAPRVFMLLNFALDCLARDEVARAAGCYLQLLACAGLLPAINACARCGRALGDEAALEGVDAFVCARCAAGNRLLSAEAWGALRTARVASERAAREVEVLIVSFFSHHVGRDLLLNPLG